MNARKLILLSTALVSTLVGIFVGSVAQANVEIEGQKVPAHLRNRPDSSFRQLPVDPSAAPVPGWIIPDHRLAPYVHRLQQQAKDDSRTTIVSELIQNLRESGKRESVAFITLSHLQKIVATFEDSGARLQALSMLLQYTDTRLPKDRFGTVDEVAQVFTPSPNEKVASLRHQQHLAKEQARKILDQRVADQARHDREMRSNGPGERPRGVPVRQR